MKDDQTKHEKRKHRHHEKHRDADTSVTVDAAAQDVDADTPAVAPEMAPTTAPVIAVVAASAAEPTIVVPAPVVSDATGPKKARAAAAAPQVPAIDEAERRQRWIDAMRDVKEARATSRPQPVAQKAAAVETVKPALPPLPGRAAGSEASPAVLVEEPLALDQPVEAPSRYPASRYERVEAWLAQSEGRRACVIGVVCFLLWQVARVWHGNYPTPRTAPVDALFWAILSFTLWRFMRWWAPDHA